MFKQLRNGLTITSVIYLLLGVFLVGWPDTSIRLCCYALGALLLLNGVGQILVFCRHRPEGFFMPYFSLIGGVLCVAAGLFLLLQPRTAISLFPILFGLFVVLDSISRFGSALDLYKAGYERWWTFLLLGLLSVGLGGFMIANPFGTVTAMVTAVGVILLIEGCINLFGLLFARLMLGRLGKLAEKSAKLAEQAAAEEAQLTDVVIEGTATEVPTPEPAPEKTPDDQLNNWEEGN